MKRVWIACGLLAAVFALTLCHSVYLTRFTGQITGFLEQAEIYAESGDWSIAESYHAQAHQLWNDKSTYLHILLRHSDIDSIYASFHEVTEFLECQEGGEYSAANARLIVQLNLLKEAEQLTLKNVL